jgi:hypothetical protein
MNNGDAPENLNIQPGYQNRPTVKPATGVKELQKKPSTKSPGRKSVPPGDKKPRDPNAKSATTRKPKVVESIKMQFIQLYFRASDLHSSKPVDDKQDD